MATSVDITGRCNPQTEYCPAQPGYFSSIGINTPTFKVGEATTLFASTNFLFTTGVMICVLVGGLRIAYAGALKMKASHTSQQQAKEVATRAVFGMLGVLSLFAVLYAVNRDLLRGEVGLSGLRTKVGGGSAPVTTTPAPTPPSGSSASYQERLKSHNAVVARLSPSGINTNRNNAPCTEEQFKETAPGCTSLAFLPEETIQLLLRINASCGCTLIITGGTEPGHSTHGEHKRAVDLRIRASKDETDPLYKYIKAVGSARGPSSRCYQQYVYSSFTFCDETPGKNSTWAPHFHVR